MNRRHYARRSEMDGSIDIVDGESGFVRAILPYDCRFTCNADQHNQAERICAALDEPMASVAFGHITPPFGPRTPHSSDD